MIHVSDLFINRENVPLEIEYHPAKNARMCLIVWPCMTGSFRMYRVPIDVFTEQGISLLLYNPRSHGKSEGQITRESSVDDLEYYLKKNPPNGIPIVIMGHSAGANAALKFGTHSRIISRFYLTAPVLDSRESLDYMFEKGNIGEFNILLAQRSHDPGQVISILNDARWFDIHWWKNKNLREYLDKIPSDFLIGSFLEGLFFPTHNSFDDLALHRNISTMLLPTDDRWYPRQRIHELCDKNGISRHIIPEARDHFITGAWKNVWSSILNDIKYNPPRRIM